MSDDAKSNNQIIIDGLISRVRALEVEVRDRDFSLKMMTEFLSNHKENGLTAEQTKGLVWQFDGYVGDLCCSGLFDYIETDTGVFTELMTANLLIKPECEEEPTDRFAMGTPSVAHAGENKDGDL